MNANKNNLIGKKKFTFRRSFESCSSSAHDTKSTTNSAEILSTPSINNFQSKTFPITNNTVTSGFTIKKQVARISPLVTNNKTNKTGTIDLTDDEDFQTSYHQQRALAEKSENVSLLKTNVARNKAHGHYGIIHQSVHKRVDDKELCDSSLNEKLVNCIPESQYPNTLHMWSDIEDDVIDAMTDDDLVLNEDIAKEIDNIESECSLKASDVVSGAQDMMDRTSFNMDSEEDELFGNNSDTEFTCSPPVVSQQSSNGLAVSSHGESPVVDGIVELEKYISDVQIQMNEHMSKWKELSNQKKELEKKLVNLQKNNSTLSVFPSESFNFTSYNSMTQPNSSLSNGSCRQHDIDLTNSPTSDSCSETTSKSKLSITSSNVSQQGWLSKYDNFSPPTELLKENTSCSKYIDRINDNMPSFSSTQVNKIKSVTKKSYANHPLYSKVMATLKSSFGLRMFRENQLDAIMSALDGKDCFILMPTGGGKSLCYQLTSIVTDGLSVVVSPLRSLIADQVQKLKSLKISAAHLSSDVTKTVEQEIYVDLCRMQPKLKLLYVTPEKLSISNKLISTLQNLFKRKMLARFVIDEAHCISQWGHDFRPDYKKLNLLRNNYANVPIMALTATATPRVQKDILNQLRMKTPSIYQQSFNRSNLQYYVLPKSKKTLMEIACKIKTEFCNKSGIVYCFSRKDCDSTAQYLKASGVSAAAYHAGLTDNQRSNVHESWLKNKFKIVCATIAFGMGIDKPDVRFVFHYTLPKSVEGYFQESGRAGRDNRKSVCVLYYQYSDMYKIRRMIEFDKDATAETRKVHMDNLYRVVQYCENKIDCRRAQQIHYFGEKDFDSSVCKENLDTTCDNCMVNEQSKQVDVTGDTKSIIKAVNEICHNGNMNFRMPLRTPDQRVTLVQFVDIFKGSQNAKSKNYVNCSLYNKGNQYQRTDAERLFRHLVLTRVLSEELFIGSHENVISYLKLGPKSTEVLSNKHKIYLSIHDKKQSETSSSKKRKSIASEESAESLQLKEQCLDELMELRNQIATHNHLSNPETIIGINVLRGLADELPANVLDMLSCIGITENWYQMWGEDFLEVTKMFHDKKSLLTVSINNIAEQNKQHLTDVSSPYFATDDTDDYDYEAERVQGGKSGGRGGYKGKRGGGKRKYGRKSKYSKKSDSSNSKQSSSGGGGWPPAWQPSTTASTGWKSTTGRKLGLMAPPQPKRPRF